MTRKKDISKEKWMPRMFPLHGNETEEAAKFLSDLIKINSTNPPGNETAVAEFCEKILEEEGFENVEIIESAPGRGNLLCRWKGSDPTAKSLLLLSHLDVVAADASNWEKAPFGGEMDDQYVWGRGSIDCKGMVVAETLALILLKREGFQPKGDVILALTADEEAGGEMGVGYLVQNYWEKIKTDYIVNEGGGILLPLGKNPKDYVVQTGEKGVFWTKVIVKGTGGHGSMPINKNENAMLKISKITQKIIEYKYPVEISQSMRDMTQQISLPGVVKRILTSKRLVRPMLKLADRLAGNSISKIMLPFVIDVINPTGFKGSDKVNVIPQQVEMTFDCRLLPGHNRDTLNNLLKKALGKKLFNEIEIIPIEPTQLATVNSIENPFWNLAGKIMNELHEGSRLVPMLSAGSTDSKYFREKGGYALGICPMRIDPNMSLKEFTEMGHGKNERMWIPSLSYSMEFFYRLIKCF